MKGGIPRVKCSVRPRLPGGVGAAGIMVLWLICAGARGADRPYGHGDITLGDSFQRLAATLDLRDINAALTGQAARKAAMPDLGRRGYGCVRRDDAYADVTCVSHDEKVGGADTREIRLQFLGGVLQQLSITAELKHVDAVMEAVRAQHGAPHRAEPAPAGGYPSFHWRNSESSIVAYSGKDLVFVSFELATYAEGVKRRQSRERPVNECR